MNLLFASKSIPSMVTVFLTVGLVALFQLPVATWIASESMTFGILLNEIIVIAGIPLVLIILQKWDRQKLLPFHRPTSRQVVLTLLFILGADILIDYMAAATEYFFSPPHQEHMERVMEVGSFTEYLWKAMLICLLPGICEEILFRGFCQNAIAHHLGVRASVLLSALLFALLHDSPWYFHLYLFLGLVLAFSFATTGTLIIPILAHTFNNLWTVTQHHFGSEYPIRSFTHPFDLMIMGGGFLLFLGAGWGLWRGR